MTGSFETYLQELADPGHPLALSKLTNLSSMQADQLALFRNVWLEMELRLRQKLVQELIDLAEDAVELNFDAVHLLALGDRDPGVRRAAIKGLCEYEGRDLIDALIGLLERDSDAGVRAEAALALGRFVLQAEFGLLKDGDATRIEQRLRQTAEDAGEVVEVRARALEAVGARSQPWVGDLIRSSFESGDRRLWLSAVHAMGRSCDTVWLSALFAAVESDDAEMRFEAAGALGAIADQSATPHLLSLLADDDEEVREAAVTALGEIGGREAKEALQGVLAGDNRRLSEAAFAALAEIDFEEDPVGVKLRGVPE